MHVAWNPHICFLFKLSSCMLFLSVSAVTHFFSTFHCLDIVCSILSRIFKRVELFFSNLFLLSLTFITKGLSYQDHNITEKIFIVLSNLSTYWHILIFIKTVGKTISPSYHVAFFMVKKLREPHLNLRENSIEKDSCTI